MENIKDFDVQEYTRYMDYSLGTAFAELSRSRTLNITDVIKIMITDACTWQPVHLNAVLKEQLRRKLIMDKPKFEMNTWYGLVSILEAAAGDYELLMEFAKDHAIFNAAAHEILFDETQLEDAA